MDTRVKFCAIIGIVTMVVVVLVHVNTGSSDDKSNLDDHHLTPDSKCRLQRLEPELDVHEVVNFKSADLKAMANFVGYLIYRPTMDQNNTQPSTDTYLRLELESIEQTGSLGDPKEPARLKLSTSCADLTIVLPAASDDGAKPAPFQIELDNISSDGDRSVCSIRSSTSIGASQYFSCQGPWWYECVQTKGKRKFVADLYIGRLEFEVDGDQEAIKKGIFSKDKVICKCCS